MSCWSCMPCRQEMGSHDSLKGALNNWMPTIQNLMKAWRGPCQSLNAKNPGLALVFFPGHPWMNIKNSYIFTYPHPKTNSSPREDRPIHPTGIEFVFETSHFAGANLLFVSGKGNFLQGDWASQVHPVGFRCLWRWPGIGYAIWEVFVCPWSILFGKPQKEPRAPFWSFP